MKHAQLQAIVHNVADSLGSGICLMIGYYAVDVYFDARNSPTGTIKVDLLRGVVVEGDAGEALLGALKQIPAALAEQCERAGGSWDEYRRAEVVFYGRRTEPGFTIVVEDQNGKCTETDYQGWPARRPMVFGDNGRLFRKPSRS
jgi:hypothetical protein